MIVEAPSEPEDLKVTAAAALGAIDEESSQRELAEISA
jgi:hypothetical protein